MFQRRGKCGNGPPFWYICQVDTDLAKNLAAVRLRIGAAAARAGRGVDEIKLVAVSKTHPAASIAEAIEAGITIFGENKVQEAAEKIPHVGRNAAEWHLIGHLQSNKVRRAVKLFDVIESVDSIESPNGLSVFALKRAEIPERFRSGGPCGRRSQIGSIRKRNSGHRRAYSPVFAAEAGWPDDGSALL